MWYVFRATNCRNAVVPGNCMVVFYCRNGCLIYGQFWCWFRPFVSNGIVQRWLRKSQLDLASKFPIIVERNRGKQDRAENLYF